MVDRSELQNKARLVESHRQHLEELQRRMEQITGVINEHQVTEEILSRLTDMSNSSNAKAHIPSGQASHSTTNIQVLKKEPRLSI
mgnify:CR=1 FL=1